MLSLFFVSILYPDEFQVCIKLSFVKIWNLISLIQPLLLLPVGLSAVCKWSTLSLGIPLKNTIMKNMLLKSFFAILFLVVSSVVYGDVYYKFEIFNKVARKE